MKLKAFKIIVVQEMYLLKFMLLKKCPSCKCTWKYEYTMIL